MIDVFIHEKVVDGLVGGIYPVMVSRLEAAGYRLLRFDNSSDLMDNFCAGTCFIVPDGDCGLVAQHGSLLGYTNKEVTRIISFVYCSAWVDGDD